jgi:uncharacterized membrane protein (UPF0127 family)
MSEVHKDGGSDLVALVNERTRAVIASHVEVALSQQARRVGLLGRTHLDAAHALYLIPCVTIHTAFMRFPIDVVFVGRDGAAIKVIHALKPWRAALSFQAYAVIEFAAGTLRRHDIRIGDRLHLKPESALTRPRTPQMQLSHVTGGTRC